MKVLDLFCGGGGAAEGMMRAGCEVVGLDNVESHSSSYPGEFWCVDINEFLERTTLPNFDFVWASPPCQGYSSHVSSTNSKWVPYSQGTETPRLIAKVRSWLSRSGVPYAIENVMGAKSELHNPTLLCGTMFGLPIARHRLIETSFPMLTPSHAKCSGVAKRYSEMNGIDYRDMSVTGKSRRAGCLDTWRKLLGIERTGHMTASELAESIPPAYSQYVVQQLEANG